MRTTLPLLALTAWMMMMLAAAQDVSSVWNQVDPSALISPSPVVPVSDSATAASSPNSASVGDPVASAHKQRRKKHRRNKLRNRDKERNAAGSEDPDEYYYDRDDGYGAPKAPAYEAPAAVAAPAYEAPASSYEAPAAPSYEAPAAAPAYQAPSYQAPSYQAPSYQSESSYHDEGYGGGGGGYAAAASAVVATAKKAGDNIRSSSSGHGDYSYGQPNNGFNDFLNALIAFLPIGLFLAAIPPNLITINTSPGMENLAAFASSLAAIIPLGLLLATLAPSTVTVTGRRRRRESSNDLEGEEYRSIFLEDILDRGYDKMEDPECQKMLFCQMSFFGGTNERANAVQKAFFRVASQSPKSVTETLGLTEVFAAAVSGDCDRFRCNESKKSTKL